MTPSTLFTADFAERPHWWDLAAPEACDEGAPAANGRRRHRRLRLHRRWSRRCIWRAPGGRCWCWKRSSRATARRAATPAISAAPSSAPSPGWNSITARSSRPASIASWTPRGSGCSRWSAELGIQCHIAQPGRFIGATSEAHYKDLAQELEIMRRRLGYPYEMIAPMDLRRELASDAYMGGAVIPDLGAIHPALYHQGLLTGGARRRRARLHPHAGDRARARRQGGQGRDRARPRHRARSDRRHQRLHPAARLVAGAPRHPVRRLHGRDRGAVARADGEAHPQRPHRDRQQRQHQLHPPRARPAQDPVRRPDRQQAARPARHGRSACTRW